MAGRRPGHPRQYHFPAGPFTNGRLHLGHVRTFVLGDVMARAGRQRGYDVLYAFEWDAFGLPTELAAQKQGVAPGTLAREAATRMTADLDRLGISLAWDHVYLTCEPRYYRWTQWFFLKLYEHGFLYRGKATLNYCATCETTLAHLEVADGACWRCQSVVERRESTQWFVRLGDASAELLDGLSKLDAWSPTVIRLLAGFIGEVEGQEVDLTVTLRDGSERVLTVFVPDATPRDEVDAVLVAPGHTDVADLLRAAGGDVAEGLLATATLRRRRREDVGADVVDTGLRARRPGWPMAIPVLASSIVDPAFARGAVLRPAIEGAGIDWRAAGGEIRHVVVHRVQDWLVSRQRSWGTPIPVLLCPHCGDVPVPEEWLPFELELDEAGRRVVKPVACPRCGEEAVPDGDTSDCFFDVAWSLLGCATSLPEDPEAFFEQAKGWRAVDWFHNGLDSFLYAHLHRYISLVLREIGYVDDPEPIRRFYGHAMVTLDGRKMSKHEGNTVDAATLLDELGADLLRVQILWAANPSHAIEFRPERDKRAETFLLNVRSLVFDNLDLVLGRPEVLDGSPFAKELEEATAVVVERVTRFLDHYRPCTCLQELDRFVGRLTKFRRRLLGDAIEDASAVHAFGDALRVLVQLVAPFAPHLAEEMWEALEPGAGPLALGPWPGGHPLRKGDTTATIERRGM
ncbi:MAG: class I tRNA ligase family protein [Actinobacteria bacterium]|nr:class I tRNA ligase family protein [Actinomycetota bacterium]